MEAIYSRCFELLVYVVENKVPWDPTCSEMAFQVGNEKMLEYLDSKKFHLQHSHVAAAKGNIPALRFLLSKGLLNDPELCDQAARCSKLEALKFLHENGAPWDASLLYGALRSSDELTLDYLSDCGLRFPSHEVSLPPRISDAGLRFLLKDGDIPRDKLLNWSIFYGEFSPLKYLHENGCELTESHLEMAKELPRSNKELIDYIEKHLRK